VPAVMSLGEMMESMMLFVAFFAQPLIALATSSGFRNHERFDDFVCQRFKS
jgi:hypothetical protein